MVIWNILVTSLALFMWVIICEGGAPKQRFSMGCECGMRKLDKDAEADCEESARLEAPDQAGTHQSLKI